MSRSGYDEDYDCDFSLDLYRANVDRATAGKRGQAMLRGLLVALEAMPEKRLIKNEVETETGEVCMLGQLAKVRGLEIKGFDEPNDIPLIAKKFNIAVPLAAELIYINDEGGSRKETPEDRYVRVVAKVRTLLKQPAA